MQEDKKINVQAVQRVHFVPRSDGVHGFALVIEPTGKEVIAFDLPLASMVEIFAMMPKLFGELLKKQPIESDIVPENLTHAYWDGVVSLISNPSIYLSSQLGVASTKLDEPVKKAAKKKVAPKQPALDTKQIATKESKNFATPIASKKVAAKTAKR
jgi:hypothetical protein